jgi:hypothetical protein
MRWPTPVRIARIFATNLAAWSVVSAMGTGSVTGQLANQGGPSPYLEMFCEAWLGALIQSVAGAALYAVLWRRPALLERALTLSALFCTTLLLVAPCDVVYRVIGWPGPAGIAAAMPHGLAAAVRTVAPFEWFVDFMLLTGTFTVQAAVCIRRQGRARERALDLADKENLRLRLELEQLRMLGLRAQLEPHFLFNALNAISALVRADDRKTALAGIARLSGLLRYALTASAREWVTVGEELSFVQDYLALQRLRYGARMQVEVAVDDDSLLAAPCPPLLLQPLVENALRHDLDCHDGASDIRLHMRASADVFCIVISNPAPPAAAGQAAANPGLGLGLRHTEASLQLAFGPSASLQTRTGEGRFTVTLRLPLPPC